MMKSGAWSTTPLSYAGQPTKCTSLSTDNCFEKPWRFLFAVYARLPNTPKLLYQICLQNASITQEVLLGYRFGINQDPEPAFPLLSPITAVISHLCWIRALRPWLLWWPLLLRR